MNVTTIALLEDLQGPWSTLQIQLIGPGTGSGDPVTMEDVYPFMSVIDLKRHIWMKQGGDPRWAPERVFLGVRGGGGGAAAAAAAAGIRPLEFYWPGSTVELPDPLLPESHKLSPLLMDEAGNRKPVAPTMIGSLILETALAPEITTTGEIPVIVAVALAAVHSAGAGEVVSTQMILGFYQLYFPWITAPAALQAAGSTVRSAADAETYAATVPYMEDRIGRIQVVQKALQSRVGGASVSMMTMVRMRWVLPPPAAKPESLEKTFYSLPASATIPFLRYFPMGGGTPLLKLGLKPDGSPIIENPQTLATYINQPAPHTKSAVILARVPMNSPHVEAGAAFTLYMFEDGTGDITLEVPQRGATYAAIVAAEAQRILRGVMVAIGFPPEFTAILRDLHATYKWIHPNPRSAKPTTAARLLQRMAALTPFFETVPTVPGETALAVFQWRAVSNYESEAAQFAYITQMVLRGGGVEEGGTALAAYVAELSERFGMTAEAANATIERWMERRGDAVAPAAGAVAGTMAVPRHSTGASIAVFGAHPEYTMEIQGIDSFTELQRILSVMGVLLGSPTASLAVTPPAPEVVATGVTVVMAEEQVVDAAAAAAAEVGAVAEEGEDIGEMDPAMAGLMADLGMLGLGPDEEEEEEAAVPKLMVEEKAAAPSAPAGGAGADAGAAAVLDNIPDLDAAVAALDDDCHGTPWSPGEPPLKVKKEWYMDKLKKVDDALFGYRAVATGRVKGYSKSCQRRDGRQPNILTETEYIRVRHCYEDAVRFVLLPPSKPSDLPQDPEWKPKVIYDTTDYYYMVDPISKKPMWTVYGYENKTRPGERAYLMCPDLWCDRDNLPLLRDEYMGTQGRGFTKPPNTCAFCGGRAIADLSNPKSGESVIVRVPKESTQKLHSFIGTITRNKHPNGYPLPCCDSSPRLLKKYMTEAYFGRLVYGRDLGMDDDEEGGGGIAGAGAEGPEPEEDAEPAPELALAEHAATGVTADETTIDYRARFISMQTQYIIKNEKILDPGRIGILPPLLDAFFGQNSQQALELRGIRATFVEEARIFVRVGVDNRLRAPGMNLFAALAPLFGTQSAEQTQRLIVNSKAVRAFESANYGTLVHEFAARSRLTDARVNASLAAFAAEYSYPLLTESRPHIVRLYKAWYAYLEYLTSLTEPKALRHIEHMLAQPGVFTPRGLLLIVLEQTGDKIEIACPSFGIPSASTFGKVPVAFMWHDKRDETWEPIVLYNGTKNAVLFFGDKAPELDPLGSAMQLHLLRWIRDWRGSSLGCGRPAPPPHVWTPDRDTFGLPHASDLDAKVIVRDRSNRLAGVLRPAAAAGAPALFVPALDDGDLSIEASRIYEAQMIPAVPLATYLAYYTEQLAPSYPRLKPTRLLWRGEPAQIVGFRVASGTIIPVAPEPFNPASATLPADPVDEFPWERDALILRAPDAAPEAAMALEESTASVEEQMSEAYQLLRLSFSNWLLTARGAALKTDLGLLLKSDGLPLYEKRKRADIMLEPVIREMVRHEVTDQRKTLSLLRQDCVSLPADSCASASGCRWSGGRCMIHAPTREEGTDPVRIFTARLSDDILRYSAGRREMFDQKVSEIRVPRGAVRIGNELFLATRLKETGASVLERLGFTGAVAERFPEEMLRFEGLEEEEGGAGAANDEKLPPSWVAAHFDIPTVHPGLDNGRLLAFAGVTAKTIEEWTAKIQARRTKLGLPGPVDRPFQWSIQDFYAIASLFKTNILFVRGGKIDRWIAPPSADKKHSEPVFMIFWGPQELLVFHTVRGYRFPLSSLPLEMRNLLDAASPIPEEEARGYIEGTAAAAAGAGATMEETVTVVE